MSYITLRFIDLFRPGDSIPAGHYPPEAIAKMIASGKVKRVDEPRTVVVAPAPPPTTTRKAKRKA